MWNSCPRRFRWQYYGEDESLEALRWLQSERQWTTRVTFGEIDRSLTEADASVRELELRRLIASADRRITREWEGRGANGLLSACVNFPEDGSQHGIPGRVRARVWAWLGRFAASATTAELLATPPARRRPPLADRSVEVGGVPVAAPPTWSRLTRDGRVVLCAWSVTKRPVADAAEWAASALLLCARHRVEMARLSVSAEHLLADGERRTFEFDAGLLIEEQNRILEDAARWRAALAAGEAGFPPRPESRRCCECPFLRLCPEGMESAGRAT